MKNKILTIFVCLLVSFSYVGTISSISLEKKTNDNNPKNPEFTHSVLGEVFMNSSNVPSKYLHHALIQLYGQGWYPFYYITYLFDKNNNSRDRKEELGVTESPMIVFDGGYEKISFVLNSTEEWINKLNESFFDCGSRDVKDIDLSLDLEWQGAVNNNPETCETDVPIEVILNWTVSEMKIEVEAKNNEGSEYDGHVHVQVTEVESEWWNDKFGEPYTFEFKDYAYNDDVILNDGETWDETIYWDGCEYNDGDNPPRYFDHIKQDNIMVFAFAMNNNLNQWVDETVGKLAGINTDPKTFDVYFGDCSYPPPKVLSNSTSMKYDPPGDLNCTTTYCWRVDVINNLGEIIPGEVWSFTTRGNSPPNEPTPVFPPGGAENLSICYAAIEWNCSDPDGDDLTYDIYFGDSSPPPLIESNWSGNTYDPPPYGPTFEFETTYYWKIVAWDPYGESATGGIWEFKTEKNVPPNPAKPLIPLDGAQNVPVNAILCWNGSDSNLCDTLKYDVYFGLYDPPTLQTGNQSDSCFDPYGPDGDLQMFETYYWKLVTWDKSGERSESPVWTFETGVPDVPEPPEIEGPNQGQPGVIYEFDFVSCNPYNKSIMYEIIWDDGTYCLTDYYKPCKVVTLPHSWDSKEAYVIQARVITFYGLVSDWAEHEIIIPRSKEIRNFHDILSWLWYRYPMLERLLSFMKVF